jgi:predicted lipid-binding transport protein (Tim44 family)
MLRRLLARPYTRPYAYLHSRLRAAWRALHRQPTVVVASGAAAADIEEVLRLARQSFVQLQAAWDRADLGALRLLTTEPLLEDLQHQLAQRGPGPNHTEVVSLDVRLLGLEELHEAFVASVEFSGLIRERLDAGACPFRELWLLANIKAAGRGWQLARVQSLS